MNKEDNSKKMQDEYEFVLCVNEWMSCYFYADKTDKIDKPVMK